MIIERTETINKVVEHKIEDGEYYFNLIDYDEDIRYQKVIIKLKESHNLDWYSIEAETLFTEDEKWGIISRKYEDTSLDLLWDVENYMIGEKGEKITKEEYNKKRKEVLEQLLK
ncbi:MAG: hypothetical protein CMH22_06105 [Methylophaga sp.]|nr:hypothetical protein [Methylophaga sp.]|tara:strand:+ start:50747 stop:51088 length:342 start_codon:yes stop_codon:yes gene_type:complete